MYLLCVFSGLTSQSKIEEREREETNAKAVVTSVLEGTIPDSTIKQ